MGHLRTPVRSRAAATGLRLAAAAGLAALTIGPAAGLAQTGTPPGWPAVRSSSGWTATVAPGVAYSRYRVATADGPLAVHQLVLDLGNPAVRLDVALAHNRLISPDETVSSMVRRSGAVAGVNADFFDIGESGMPLNIMVRDGRLLRSPTRRVALVVRPDGSVEITRYEWTGSVVNAATRAAHRLAGFNTGFVPNGIVAISNERGYGAPVPSDGVRQTVAALTPIDDAAQALPTLAASLEPVPAGDARYVVTGVWPQQAYYAPFPEGTILLVGRGTAAAWLAGALPAGAAVETNLTTAPDWRAARAVVGGGPLLVANGRVVDDPYSPAPKERTRRRNATNATRSRRLGSRKTAGGSCSSRWTDGSRAGASD
jgi:hypothetical protein